MNAKELRTKDVAALRQELNDSLRALFSLRMRKATQQLTNTSQFSKMRRNVARVQMVLAEKAQGGR